MISCIGIVVSYAISYDMTTLDIVIRYNRVGIVIVSSKSLPCHLKPTIKTFI
jgi:hypothetical protein